MHLNLSADEVLSTTRAVRKRLDFDRPVSREVIEECLQLALQAPTGSNSQGWQWVFVTDPAKKQALADIYATNFAEYAKFAQSNSYEEGDLRHEQRDRAKRPAGRLPPECAFGLERAQRNRMDLDAVDQFELDLAAVLIRSGRAACKYADLVPARQKRARMPMRDDFGAADGERRVEVRNDQDSHGVPRETVDS